ncbi:MAG: hypothetical protein IKO85_03935 [Bacteroidaceae bacterium]|nr:hypothetical protein [Bacteroidaceae bacterium]
MTTRRDKAKPQKPQPSKQLEAAGADSEKKPQPKRGGTWKENLGKYLIDISKYVMTGVIITSLFKDLDEKNFIYILAFVIAIPALIVGLVLTNKKKGD